MKLDLSALNMAIESLDRSVRIANKFILSNSLSHDEVEVIKAGVIQNFEFTYELCWKFMKRWLDKNYSESFTAGLTRRQLFRYAAENLLISDLEKWIQYHESRNITSHTYDSDVANEVFDVGCEFLPEAKKLYKAIESRND